MKGLIIYYETQNDNLISMMENGMNDSWIFNFQTTSERKVNNFERREIVNDYTRKEYFSCSLLKNQDEGILQLFPHLNKKSADNGYIFSLSRAAQGGKIIFIAKAEFYSKMQKLKENARNDITLFL